MGNTERSSAWREVETGKEVDIDETYIALYCYLCNRVRQMTNKDNVYHCKCGKRYRYVVKVECEVDKE